MTRWTTWAGPLGIVVCACTFWAEAGFAADRLGVDVVSTFEKVRGSVAVATDGRFAAVQTTAGGLVVVDAGTGKDLFAGKNITALGTAFAGDGKSVWVGTKDGSAVQYSLPAVAELRRLKLGTTVPIDQLAVSADGKHVAWRSNDIRAGGLVSAVDGKVVAEWDEVTDHSRTGDLQPLIAFSADGRYVTFPTRSKKLLDGVKNQRGRPASEMTAVWDISGSRVRRFVEPYLSETRPQAVWHGNSLYFCSRRDTWDWRLVRYDAPTDRLTDLGKMFGGSHTADVDVSPSGKWATEQVEQDVFQIYVTQTGKVSVPVPPRSGNRSRFIGWDRRGDREFGWVSRVSRHGGLFAIDPTDGRDHGSVEFFDGKVGYRVVPLAEGRFLVLWDAVVPDPKGNADSFQYGDRSATLLRHRPGR